MCEMSKEKKAPRKPNKISPWRLGFMNFIWISILVVVMGVFTYKQSEVRITQAIDTHLIEFKFQDNFGRDDLSYELADGFAQKLMADIAQVSDYRVMLKKAAFTTVLFRVSRCWYALEKTMVVTFLRWSTVIIHLRRCFLVVNMHLRATT